MKKFLSVVLVLIMSVSMCACGGTSSIDAMAEAGVLVEKWSAEDTQFTYTIEYQDTPESEKGIGVCTVMMKPEDFGSEYVWLSNIDGLRSDHSEELIDILKKADINLLWITEYADGSVSFHLDQEDITDQVSLTPAN